MKHGDDFISIHDLSTEEVWQLLNLAADLKQKQKAGIPHPYLQGKTLGMIFEKASTRTRVSFETGIYQLGGQGLFLSGRDLQIGRGEPIKDTARVLSRYVDGIMIRTFAHDTVLELAHYADVPVINALTDLLHPCQAMADMMTAIEYKGSDLSGKKLTFIGDGNNMAHSLMFACAKLGMHFTFAGPKGYEPNKKIVELATADAKITGGTIEILNDPMAAAKDSDIFYTDVYASMGQEAEYEARLKIFKGFQVNSKVLSVAQPDAIVMHCLPAHREEEITDEVFEAQAQVIFDEAENRLHMQKAIMATIM
ncbi:ornithine carbamoyltransferase [Veillonella sp. R32]|uniref:ornithine carbamoyltransferase n=1 Tax=Veillonella sp. R32 TaxID=2021312 RepID=UPI001389DCEB|nr:ornithine carbamoyltransferase [Veillonella sp. R32]KAF1682448.1 ornithine carbamoyltransferase [Veillonella sp. R32]